MKSNKDLIGSIERMFGGEPVKDRAVKGKPKGYIRNGVMDIERMMKNEPDPVEKLQEGIELLEVADLPADIEQDRQKELGRIELEIKRQKSYKRKYGCYDVSKMNGYILWKEQT